MLAQLTQACSVENKRDGRVMKAKNNNLRQRLRTEPQFKLNNIQNSIETILFVSLLTAEGLLFRANQWETFGCSQIAAKRTPDLPHFSLQPLPPHSKAGISC